MDNNTKKGILKSFKDMILGSSKNDVPAVDFNRYTNLEDMYGYIGFIDKDGGFYRVREIGSQNCGHGEWAYYFLDYHKKDFGITPSLKFNNNINTLVNHPDFSMVFLYEDQDLIGEYSHIDSSYYMTFNEMTSKQREVMEHLVYRQNKKADSLYEKSNRVTR